MGQKILINRFFKCLFFAICMVFLSLSLQSKGLAAPCISGAPCVVAKTPNDPYTPDDGPNRLTPDPPAPNAEKSSSALCNADFMNQIFSEATLQARRQTIKAGIVIRKPDSVLEYNCYAGLARDFANQAGSGFGDGDPGSQLSDLADTSVLTPLLQYIANNFGHDFLGGHAVALDTTPGVAAGCNLMNQAFEYAKCMNFRTDDDFYTFSDLASMNPRQFPSPCADTGVTADLINVARNPRPTFTYADFDPLDAPFMRHEDGPTCAPGHETGVEVEVVRRGYNLLGIVLFPGRDTINETVCPTPGCVYNGSECVSIY